MIDPQRFIVAEGQLMSAFAQEGCAICRLMDETASRYIENLLHENVNEYSSRIHLVRGLGFCPEHTWRMYYIERTKYNDFAGISIIYSDLVRRVAQGVQEFGAAVKANVRVTHRTVSFWTRVRAALGWGSRGAPRPEGLWPIAPCRACQFVEAAEQNTIRWFVYGCTDPEFRARYTASDGLCRKHLALVLEVAAEVRPDVVQFLIDAAVSRLGTLARDLDEYERKRAWQYRTEKRTAAEEAAPRKATQFFGGPEPGLVHDGQKAAEMATPS